MKHLIVLGLFIIIFNVWGRKEVRDNEMPIWMPTLVGMAFWVCFEFLYWFCWVYF